jgi:multidrug transporter EmrE-like cation transporter
MVTTGIKLYVGFFLAALTGAIVYGYTTGGSSVGPLTIGYKGAVGDHLGYGILLGFAVASLGLVVAHAAFRDADPAAAAQLLGLDAPPAPQRPVLPSLWPLLGGLGAGATLIGLVIGPVVFGIGLAILAATTVEWMMEAWADRATGDQTVNRELRDRIMRPLEVPALAAIGIAVIVLAASQILLASSKAAAVWVAIGIAGAIFIAAIVVSRMKRIPNGLVPAVLVVGIVGLIAGGIVAAAAGPREFHKHGEDKEHGAEHSSEEPVAGEAEG